MTLAIPTGILAAAVGIAVWLVTASAAEGRLGRNSMTGLRTPATQRSDAAWVAGHRAALPAARIVGGLGVGLGLGLVGSGALAGPDPTPLTWILFTVAFVVLPLGLALVVNLADRAGRAVSGPDQEG